MMGPNVFLLGGVLPAVVAAATLASVWKLTRNARAAWSLAVGLAYVVGHWALDAHGAGLAAALTKSYQPHEARDWLPFLVLLAIGAELVMLAKKPWANAIWLARSALCLLVPWRLLSGTAYLPQAIVADAGFDTGAWSNPEAITWLTGTAATLLTAWTLVAAGGLHGLPRLRGSLATMVALGAAVAVALSGSFTYGQLLGVLTAALAGCGIVAAAMRLENGPEAAAGPLIVVFGSVLLMAHFLSELELIHAVLLLAAMTVGVGWLPSRTPTGLRFVLCLAPLAAAVALAVMNLSAAQVEIEPNPYLDFQR